MKHGVPFDKLFLVDRLMKYEIEAMSIVFSEFEGGVFNWSAWAWEKKE